MSIPHRTVIVVGAGPIGLSAALALRASGLFVTVLEAEPEDRVRPGSRAIYVHGTTLRVLERLRPGLGRALAARGAVWRTRRTFWRGREVFCRTYGGPPPSGLPHFTSLPQTEVEKDLLAACRDAGVELVWNAPVRGVRACADRVEIRTDDAGAWSTSYVLGADGARSAVREAIGVPLEGKRSANSFVIVDVAEISTHPRPIERVFHYDHPAVGGRNVLLVPFAGGWRADLQCRDDEDPAQFNSPEGARRWVGATLGEQYVERLTWISTYRFLQVIARSFVDAHRRVLLIGEAAHLFAPFGARGMNSGIVDAAAAAAAVRTALAAATPGDAQAAIEGFARERHAAAVWNRAAAGSALAHLRGKVLWRQACRRAAVLAAPWWERAGEWLDTAPFGPAGGPPTAARTKY